MAEKFQDLLQQLSAEFDRQVAENHALVRENLRLRDMNHIPLPGVPGEHPPEVPLVHPSSEVPATPCQQHGEKKAPSPVLEPTPVPTPREGGPKAKAMTRSLTTGSQRLRRSFVPKNLNMDGDLNTFKKQRKWYIINPESSPFMSKWDFMTMFALSYVALVTPVQVGIMEMKIDVIFVVSLLVDLIFVVDLVLQFFVMYPVKNSRGHMLEHSHKKIVLHYLKTWFPIDLITIIPFDLVSMSLEVDGLKQMKGIKIVRLLRLLKLMRILKTSRVFHRMEIGLSVPYQRFALIKFLAILLLVCHWQACVWSMTLSLADPSTPRWVDTFEEMEANEEIKTKDDPARLYIAAFYFCSYTMTSVGYGDIGPKNLSERITCIFIVLLAGLCWAYILGEVCGIVGDMNSDQQSFRKKMDNLNHMMYDRSVPQDMRRRLRSFFLSNKDSVQHVTQRELLSDMSPMLQGEVSMTLNELWLSKVSFLAEVLQATAWAEANFAEDAAEYRACMADVARAMNSQAFAQAETFGQRQVLYILYKGLTGWNNRVMKNGAVWGEDFVLSDPSLLCVARCTALTYVEVIYVDRTTFLDVVEKHRETCPHLAQRVRQFCVRLAVRRGILNEADRRKKAWSRTALRAVSTIEDIPTLEIPSPEKPCRLTSPTMKPPTLAFQR